MEERVFSTPSSKRSGGEDVMERQTIRCDDQHIFHMVVERTKRISLVYVCMTSGGGLAVSPRVCFNYLLAVRDLFDVKYGKARARVANAHAMNKSFGPELDSMMHRWNTTPPEVINPGISRIEGDIKDLKKVMDQNIQDILGRKEQIELLMDKSHDLEEEASVFQRHSTILNKKIKDRNNFYRMLLISVLLLLILFFTVSICGFDLTKCRDINSE